ncbi:Hypothetical_protein [Hexamita inflata]|uniref:Hypothetical_protein n=1 Tax=Hexamita inflata TaxID=28002 RepID=A0AA86N6Q4_9EUKA|nr:Hypothetical protein HINF_LOCUS1505 [Hexamita inflata]
MRVKCSAISLCETKEHTRVVKYNTHAYHKTHRDISWSVFRNRQMHSLQESLAGGIKQRMSVKQLHPDRRVIQLAQLTAAVDMQIQLSYQQQQKVSYRLSKQISQFALSA